jgi:hypothetical protein
MMKKITRVTSLLCLVVTQFTAHSAASNWFGHRQHQPLPGQAPGRFHFQLEHNKNSPSASQLTRLYGNQRIVLAILPEGLKERIAITGTADLKRVEVLDVLVNETGCPRYLIDRLPRYRRQWAEVSVPTAKSCDEDEPEPGSLYIPPHMQPGANQIMKVVEFVRTTTLPHVSYLMSAYDHFLCYYLPPELKQQFNITDKEDLKGRGTLSGLHEILVGQQMKSNCSDSAALQPEE